MEFAKKNGAHVRVWFEDDSWYASIPAWETCIAEGNTPTEAMQNLEEVARDWRESSEESGATPPNPGYADLGGQISLRISGHMHSWLKDQADREGISLNQLIAGVLQQFAGGSLLYEKARRLNRQSLMFAATPFVRHRKLDETIVESMRGIEVRTGWRMAG